MFHPSDTLQQIRQREESWDLYTLKEEYSPRQLDRYECFLYAYSTNQDVLEPKVSKHLVDNGYKKECLDGRQFAACLTHSVDEIYSPRKRVLLSALTYLKGLDFSGFKRQISWKLHGKEVSLYGNFQEVMDLEEKYGACSSFYFLATGLDIRSFRYNIINLEGELGRMVGHWGMSGFMAGTMPTTTWGRPGGRR